MHSSIRRFLVILAPSVVLPLAAAVAARATPSLPVIVEPSHEGQIVSPFDLHMVADGFVGAPGETHVCSDWELLALPAGEAVWTASCATGPLSVHIHLGDGQFQGALLGKHQLDADRDYQLRLRFHGSQPAPQGSVGPWATRLFHTSPATAIPPLEISDIASIPTPCWTEESGTDVILPPASPPPSLRLESAGGGLLLAFIADGGQSNRLSNPETPAGHGALQIVCDAGGAALTLPASRVSFSDGQGLDRVAFVPPISLNAGETASFWISTIGGAFALDASAPDAAPSAALTEPPVPWAVRQTGFRVERVAAGFQLPVNIAFVPNAGDAPGDPYFYVTELYGTVKVVNRSGEVRDYATGLLNFDPLGPFPGSGEKGLTGIVVDPASGDLFVSLVYAIPGVTDYHFPRVVRLHSEDGGRTAANVSTILDFPEEPSGPSHQISTLSIGPDGKLYVQIGDGGINLPALDLSSVRGKILRANLDGKPPADNPFFSGADGITARDFIFAYGFRNPFGGAWRASDQSLWEVENGPNVDRLARVVAGQSYGFDGTDASMTTGAVYNWPSSHAPVNIAFVQSETFAGSGFPEESRGHAFVTESGPTYGEGPQAQGKRISEFVLDATGSLLAGPSPLIEYEGAGRATATALAAGPDGLYFADLYKDFGAETPTEPGANVFRIRWAGIVNFVADQTSGVAPLTVFFEDRSNVPASSAWHWEFGDGGESDGAATVHVFAAPGSYDVRLTVTGSGGEAVRQKNALIVVQAPRLQHRPCLASRLSLGGCPSGSQ